MIKKGIKIKSEKEMKIMTDGGKRLERIRNKLEDKVEEGVNAMAIENLASNLIESEGGKPSFKMVPKYSWATCVNVNEGVVHGIPKESTIFKNGDIVSVDVGIFYKGFHTDTSFSKSIGESTQNDDFLESGKGALISAVNHVSPGSKIFDISETIEKSLQLASLTPVKSLVGHGIGRDLHEEPQVPCFTSGNRNSSIEIQKGMALAVEVIYSTGTGQIKTQDDGWTISTSDGKISALFEETIIATNKGPRVVTNSELLATNKLKS